MANSIIKILLTQTVLKATYKEGKLFNTMI